VTTNWVNHGLFFMYSLLPFIFHYFRALHVFRQCLCMSVFLSPRLPPVAPGTPSLPLSTSSTHDHLGNGKIAGVFCMYVLYEVLSFQRMFAFRSTMGRLIP